MSLRILEVWRRLSLGDDSKDALADAGDDAIYGGMLSLTEQIRAGPGHDIIVPTVACMHGADIIAGDGNDVVLTLDFSYGFVRADQVNLGAAEGRVKIGSPLGRTPCEVTAELDLENPSESGEGRVKCTLPWRGKLSLVDNVVELSGSLDQEGKVSVKGELYNKLANLSVSQTREMTDVQATMRGDVCICDPLKNPPPTEPMPYDYDTTTDKPTKQKTN